MCKALSQLHTQAPAHSFRFTKLAVEQAFGMRLDEIFEYIDREPVASGSIGQIHRARLSKRGAAITGSEPGQVVAVKVRFAGGGGVEGFDCGEGWRRGWCESFVSDV
jgi:aarF domain-containing kinase